MKKIITIGCTAVTLLFSACDDYLDLTPKGVAALDRTEDYVGLLESVYGFPIQSEWYLCGDIAPGDLGTIVYDNRNSMNASAYLWDEEIDRAPLMTDTGQFMLYSQCYKNISNYNIIIQNINDAKGPEEEKVIGIAQAKILRALNYFYLINTYARPYDPATAEKERGIILRKEFNLEEEGMQSTVADAYRFIQQDIEEALPHLPHKALNVFRPNQSFGYALKAKVHLFKREIDEALQASLDGIKEAETNGGHKMWNLNSVYNAAVEAFLPNSYFDMNSFTVVNLTKEEDIQWGPNTMPANSQFNAYNAFRQAFLSTGNSLRDTYFARSYDNPENLLYQSGGTDGDPSPQFIREPVAKLFSNKEDLRHTVYCMDFTPLRPTSEKNGACLMAYHIKWNIAGIRLSEVYLMAAECYARKGDCVNAMKYINDIRKNRIKTKYYVDLKAETKEEAMGEVREERKRELLFTVNGFFDMRRFCAEFNETLTREYQLSNNGKIGEEHTATLTPDSHLLTYPFPVSAMQNSNLEQNSK